jgi:hypothetical protein
VTLSAKAHERASFPEEMPFCFSLNQNLAIHQNFAEYPTSQEHPATSAGKGPAQFFSADPLCKTRKDA